MSETNKKTNNKRAIACGDMKLVDGKELVLDQENYSPSRQEVNQLAGMEIKFDEANECTVTNETPDGRVAVLDKSTGKVIGYLEGDGTVSRKLEAKDKEAKKEEEGPEI